MRDHYLVAGLSGRALMQSAQMLRLPVVVLDVFGDTEVRRSASAWARIGRLPGGIDPLRLRDVSGRCEPARACMGVVYGSGFEADPQSLELLAQGRALFGNAPDTLAQVCDPRVFFPVLDRLGVPHPEVRYRPPANPDGWLAKRPGTSGGGHVRPARGIDRAEGCYFQRCATGDVLSVTFLANGRDVRLLGVSRQWTARSGGRQSCLYGGGMSPYRLGGALYEEIRAAVMELAGWWGLRGLNGLDMVVNGGDFHVLELNARPPATFELHQTARGVSLFDAHVQACRGRLVELPAPSRRYFAHRLVYARQELRVPPGFCWPEWCADLPVAGSCIRRGDPLCTVHANGDDPRSLANLLQERSAGVRRALQPDWSGSADLQAGGGSAVCLH